MSIGDNIKQRRLSLNLTQEELADKLKISRPFLTQIERSTKIPSLILAKEISDVLNCDIKDLLDKVV